MKTLSVTLVMMMTKSRGPHAQACRGRASPGECWAWMLVELDDQGFHLFVTVREERQELKRCARTATVG